MQFFRCLGRPGRFGLHQGPPSQITLRGQPAVARGATVSGPRVLSDAASKTAALETLGPGPTPPLRPISRQGALLPHSCGAKQNGRQQEEQKIQPLAIRPYQGIGQQYGFWGFPSKKLAPRCYAPPSPAGIVTFLVSRHPKGCRTGCLESRRSGKKL